MAVTAQSATVALPRQMRTPDRRMGPRARKTVLAVHIASAGGWLGINAVVVVLIATAVLTGDRGTEALSYQSLELFAVWPLLIAASTCLLSGIALGLGSRYGLLRYWWVAGKLACNVVMVAVLLLAVRPGVAELAERGRAVQAGELSAAAGPAVLVAPLLSLAVLGSAVVLSVFKPWGRRSPPRPDQPRR